MEKLGNILFLELGIDCVHVELGYNDDEIVKECCIIDTFLKNKGDIPYEFDTYRWVDSNTGDTIRDISTCFAKVFSIFRNLHDISDEDFQEMQRKYVRMILGDCIIGNEERKLKNTSTIFNEVTNRYRLASAFDQALAFNAYSLFTENAMCYVGNQLFNASDIINFILKYYYDYISDIINNLDSFVEKDLPNILGNFNGYISDDKLMFIKNYLININGLINSQSNMVRR